MAGDVATGDAVCEVPERSWSAAVRPSRLLLAMAGLCLGAVGLWLRGLEGLGLVAVATGLLVAAVVLPTVRAVEFGFPVGVKVETAVASREEELRAAFVAQQPDLELCAQLLCDDPERAPRLLEAAWADAARDWRGSPEGPELRVYVLCVLVQKVAAYQRWGASAADDTPARPSLAGLTWEQRVTVVLHDFARLPRARVATMLERDTDEVDAWLREAAALPGVGTPGGGAP